VPLFKSHARSYGYPNQCLRDLNELQQIQANDVAAVIIEPLIQGVARMRPWPSGMLRQLRQWCDANGVFLILDEVMTGFGRTGSMFAFEQEGIVPDFLCLAKGLTGGYLPLAATITTQRVFDGFLGDAERTFYYGHSYTGSALGCAAALGSLKVFREEQTLHHLQGKIQLMSELLAELVDHPHVGDIRQCGFIAGIDVVQSKSQAYPKDFLMGAKVCMAAREHGLLTRPVLDTLVLMPPLSTTAAELRQMVAALHSGITQTCA
jgi:adenosylmethionine---8-amino-7-oxononanoate aminotransferase